MAIIEGTEFNDELFARSTGEEVRGGEGNDTLDASQGQGNNTLIGGSGDDDLFAGTQDSLLGGVGDDILDARSGTGTNILEGGAGNDLLFAATNDTLLAGTGNDSLFAGRENAILKGGTGSDQFWIVQAELPTQPNIINRFIQGVDQIGIGGLEDVTFESLTFEQQDGNTVISATVGEQVVELAILLSFPPPDQPELALRAEDFIFADSEALAVPAPTVEDATFSVAENSPEGTTVGTVIATDIEITDDPEDSDRLTYEIISGNPDPDVDENPAFSINAETGAITVADSGDLDFEATPNSFDLTVRVTDLEGLTDYATVTINLTDIDEEEAGDGNGDGIDDVNQDNVASVRGEEGEFFTLVAPEGVEFTNVELVPSDLDGDGDSDLNNPNSIPFNFPDGFFNYTILGLEPGQQLDISIIVPQTNINTYFKIPPTQENSNPTLEELEEFTYDGETGAEFFNLGDERTLVVLHFIDGGRGDADGLANGVIVDPGAPGVNTGSTASLSEDEGIFTINGATGLQAILNLTLTENESAFVNEIGVFRVDDADGRVNDILPGEAGYETAALSRGEVIFSEVETALTDLSRSLQFSGGDRLGFYLETSNGDTFFSFSAANDNNEQLRVSQSVRVFTLAWEDTNVDGLSFGGDFNDLIIDVELGNIPEVNQLVAIDQGEDQRELLDLTQLSGQQVTADFTVNREAAFNNFVGFYRIDDEQGLIGSLNPGDAGYAAAALGRRVLTALDLRVADGATESFSGTFDGGSRDAPFIIPNGTPDQLLDTDPNNDPEIYFPFIAGNADGADHVRLLGDNVFGFEDLPGDGDNDFNDIVVRIDFTIA